MGSFDYQDQEKDDTTLYLKAVEQGWPLTPAHLALAVDKVTAALAAATGSRDVARLTECLSKLHGQNLTVRLAERYADAVGADVRQAVLAPHEVAALMDSSVPASEIIVDAHVIAREQPDNSSGPLLASPLSPSRGFGAGVFDATG